LHYGERVVSEVLSGDESDEAILDLALELLWHEGASRELTRHLPRIFRASEVKKRACGVGCL
jgi:hypothetical protein